MSDIYRARRFALLTQHGKERVIAPVFREVFGAEIELVTGFDTDQLGTFTGEVPRFGSQRDAAHEKARIGAMLSGLPLSLGSEGAVGGGLFGLGQKNLEVVTLLDAERGIEIVGTARGLAMHTTFHAADWSNVRALAKAAGFPSHGLAVRPHAGSDALRKGLSDWQSLEEAFHWALTLSPAGEVMFENDMRAHLNPTRMNVIRLATCDLAERMQTLCPACGSPGFGVLRKVGGLPCEECGAPTTDPRADLMACVACDHHYERPIDGAEYGRAERCTVCNP